VPSLQERLASVLGDVLSVDEEPDGALTVRHNGTFASLRVVSIVEDLDLVSLTQILAWDLPLTKKLSDQVARQAQDTNFGSVVLLEKGVEKIAGKSAARDSDQGAKTPLKAAGKTAAKTASKTADVMSRYNFPGAGLTDDALRTLILLVLDSGARIRDQLTT
jgi:hypothetical protein